jgi:hypothetical protein
MTMGYVGGSWNYRCCFCGVYRAISYRNESYTPKGHGPLANDTRTVTDWPTDDCPARKPAQSSGRVPKKLQSQAEQPPEAP